MSLKYVQNRRGVWIVLVFRSISFREVRIGCWLLGKHSKPPRNKKNIMLVSYRKKVEIVLQETLLATISYTVYWILPNTTSSYQERRLYILNHIYTSCLADLRISSPHPSPHCSPRMYNSILSTKTSMINTTLIQVATFNLLIHCVAECWP